MAETMRLFKLKLANGKHVTTLGISPRDAIERYLAANPGSANVVGWVDYKTKEVFSLR